MTIKVEVRCTYEAKIVDGSGYCVACQTRRPMLIEVRKTMTAFASCEKCGCPNVNTGSLEVNYIYGLVDPLNGQTMYVGVSHNPIKRYRTHVGERKESEKRVWISSLLSLGKAPELVVLDVVGKKNRGATEQKWIEHYQRLGQCQFNNTRKPTFEFDIIEVTSAAGIDEGNNPPESSRDQAVHLSRRQEPQS